MVIEHGNSKTRAACGEKGGALRARLFVMAEATSHKDRSRLAMHMRKSPTLPGMREGWGTPREERFCARSRMTNVFVWRQVYMPVSSAEGP